MNNPFRRILLHLDARRINHSPFPMTDMQAALTISGMQGRAARCFNTVQTMKGW